MHFAGFVVSLHHFDLCSLGTTGESFKFVMKLVLHGIGHREFEIQELVQNSRKVFRNRDLWSMYLPGETIMEICQEAI